MKTTQFTAIYFDYAMKDAVAYANLFGSGMELQRITVERNPAGSDGFFDWTATVFYTEDAAVVAHIRADDAVAVEAVEETPEQRYRTDVLAFVEKLQARENAQNNPFPGTFSAEFNRAFVRIVISHGKSSRNAFGFIGANGDLYKAASWKTPAKNFTRGSIYNQNPLHSISLYSIG